MQSSLPEETPEYVNAVIETVVEKLPFKCALLKDIQFFFTF